MAYQVFDYQGNLLSEEEDSVIDERMALGSSPDGLNYYWFDSYEDGKTIYDTIALDGEDHTSARIVKKIESDEEV